MFLPILAFVVVAIFWAAIFFNAYRSWQLGIKPPLIFLGAVTLMAGWSLFENQNLAYLFDADKEDYSVVFCLAVVFGTFLGILWSGVKGYPERDAKIARSLSQNQERVLKEINERTGDYLADQLKKIKVDQVKSISSKNSDKAIKLLVESDLKKFDSQFSKAYYEYVTELNKVVEPELHQAYAYNLSGLSTQYHSTKSEFLKELKEYIFQPN